MVCDTKDSGRAVLTMGRRSLGVYYLVPLDLRTQNQHPATSSHQTFREKKGKEINNLPCYP